MRKKNGSLRKGKTQADVMRRAQRLLRKMKWYATFARHPQQDPYRIKGTS
jgi:hypothetical protein